MVRVRDGIKPIRLKGSDTEKLLRRYEEGNLHNVNLWLTGACNLACIYCSTDGGERDENELTLEEYKRIIDESKELGTIVISINGKGEPLLDRNFLDLVEYIYDKGMITVINSNGTLITKECARHLFENDVSIKIKIDSLNPQVNDKLVGVKGAFNRAYKGLQNLFDAGYERDIIETENEIITRISIGCLLTKLNYKTLPELFSFCRKHNAYPMINDIIPIGRVIKNKNYYQLRLSQKENRELYREFTNVMGYNYRGEANVQCSIRLGLFIDNQGYVRADERGYSCDCTLHDYNVGNIRESSVKQLWRKLIELRKKEMDITEELLCDMCPSDIFPRCFAMVETQREYEKNS